MALIPAPRPWLSCWQCLARVRSSLPFAPAFLRWMFLIFSPIMPPSNYKEADEHSCLIISMICINSPCIVSPVLPPPLPLGALLCPRGFRFAFLPPSSGMPAGGFAPLDDFFAPPPALLSSLPQRLSLPSLPLPPLPLSSRNLSRSGISLIFATWSVCQLCGGHSARVFTCPFPCSPHHPP